MKTRLIVHIDDYGVTENYSLDILKAVEKNIVDSISIMPNAFFTEKSLELIKPFRVEISVHLNLVEGIPLSNTTPLLINSNGEFKLGFLNIFSIPLLKSKKYCKDFRAQIKSELRLQVEKIKNALPDKTVLSIDSHRHIHLIPFIFDIVLELAEEYHISKIRIIDEPFYICLHPYKNIKAYFNGNILKHLVINFLSKLAIKKLSSVGKLSFINQNEKFLGILFSDLMSVSNIKKGITRLNGFNVRVLFHAGVKLKNENYLGTNKDFLSYYESNARFNEKLELLSSEFNTLYTYTNKSTYKKTL